MTDTAASVFELSYTTSRRRGRAARHVRGPASCWWSTPRASAASRRSTRASRRCTEDYRDRGLVVIGFPCDQFAHQEPGSDEEIEAFCRANYGVEFPLSTKVDVNGKASTRCSGS